MRAPKGGGAAGRRIGFLSEATESLPHAERQLRSQSPHKDTADGKSVGVIKNSPSNSSLTVQEMVRKHISPLISSGNSQKAGKPQKGFFFFLFNLGALPLQLFYHVHY